MSLSVSKNVLLIRIMLYLFSDLGRFGIFRIWMLPLLEYGMFFHLFCSFCILPISPLTYSCTFLFSVPVGILLSIVVVTVKVSLYT